METRETVWNKFIKIAADIQARGGSLTDAINEMVLAKPVDPGPGRLKKYQDGELAECPWCDGPLPPMKPVAASEPAVAIEKHTPECDEALRRLASTPSSAVSGAYDQAYIVWKKAHEMCANLTNFQRQQGYGIPPK